MDVLTVNVMAKSSLGELTKSLGSVLDQIYERGRRSSAVVFHCESTTDSPSVKESIQVISAWEKALRRLEVSQAIIVFLSDGDAFGHAFDLLLISDFRILVRNARVGFLLQNGVIRPGMSLYRLTNQIGQAHSRRVGLTGRALRADECYDLGLADEISDNGSHSLAQVLQKLENSPSAEVAIRRRLLLEAHALEYDNAIGAYLAACARDRPALCE